MSAIPKVWWGFRILDIILIPIMWAANKFRFELPQETHFWHSVSWDSKLKHEMSVRVYGNPVKKSRFSPWFHIPLFGTGWENYVVVKPVNYNETWYIGWDMSVDSVRKQEISLLPLKFGEPVRLLVLGGVVFFALDSQGNQIKLAKIGEGSLGDRQFAKTRQL